MFLTFDQLKPKYRVFLPGFPVAKVIYYVTIMAASCSAIISVSYGTITLMLRDTVCIVHLSKERSLQVVETG